MESIAIVLQIAIAAGIVNVWLLRSARPTSFRPDGANSMAEEFRRYGLSDRTRVLVGGAKLSLAAALLGGILFSPLAQAAAAMIALLMAGAVLAHVRVRDPWFKATPALLMLLMSITVVLVYSA